MMQQSDAYIIDFPLGSERLAVLAVATENFWQVNFCYDKSQVEKSITRCAEFLSKSEIDELRLRNSRLYIPEQSNSGLLSLSGYSALMIGNYLGSWYAAKQDLRKASLHWPICFGGKYRFNPIIGFKGYAADESVLPRFNCMIIGRRDSVMVFHSRWQLSCYLKNNPNLESQEKELLLGSTKNILLPEDSEDSILLIIGGLANLITEVCMYGQLITEVVEGFGKLSYGPDRYRQNPEQINAIICTN